MINIESSQGSGISKMVQKFSVGATVLVISILVKGIFSQNQKDAWTNLIRFSQIGLTG